MQNTKKKLSLLSIALVVALATAGYFWYKNQSTSSSQAKIEAPVMPPVFLTLKPFTVSLPTVKNGYDVNKVLYVGMALRVKDEEQQQLLNEYLPEVRSDLLLLLSKQDVNKLNTEPGKIELTEQVKTTLSRHYNEIARIDIEDVLFTDFIIR